MALMLRTFTEIYNTRSYDAIIRMHTMSKRQVFALTFPYDISWDIFLELLDHLIYFDESEHKSTNQGMADFAGTMQTGRRRTCHVLHQKRMIRGL